MATSLEHFAAKWNHLASHKCGKNNKIERPPGFVRAHAALVSRFRSVHDIRYHSASELRNKNDTGINKLGRGWTTVRAALDIGFVAESDGGARQARPD